MKFSLRYMSSIKNVQKLINNDLNVIEVDKYVLRVKSGTGGKGLTRYQGLGGDGGDVYLLAKPGMSFMDIKSNLSGSMKIKADSGTSSQKIKLIGNRGQDMIFPVPVGVEAVNEQTNTLIARCSRPFQKYLIAKGGFGGSSANGFMGEKGTELDLALHLKLRPNVGLVGFPNAGKSTLLKAFVPKKSVKIAPYPFTTVKPQVAFVTLDKQNRLEEDEKFTLSIADLPGLIEGASRNRGKGYQFLKHLEYAEFLLFVVDVTGFQLSNNFSEPFRTPLETVALLNKELESYDKKLVTKPCLLLLNKIDLAEPNLISELCQRFKSNSWEKSLKDDLRPVYPIRFDNVLPISAKNGSIDEVKSSLTRLYKDLNCYSAGDLLK